MTTAPVCPLRPLSLPLLPPHPFRKTGMRPKTGKLAVFQNEVPGSQHFDAPARAEGLGTSQRICGSASRITIEHRTDSRPLCRGVLTPIT